MLSASNTLNEHMKEFQRQRNLPSEFNQRHVLGLKEVSCWSSEEIELQKKHNRILQNGYSQLTADSIIALAKATHIEWLTDFVCPTIDNALKLNIAADLITQFKIDSTELNQKVQQVYKALKANHTDLVQSISAELDVKMVSLETQQLIKEKALERISGLKDEKNNPLYTQPYAEALLNNFIEVEQQRFKKQETHSLLKQKLATYYKDIMKECQLDYKPTYAIGQNRDYSILGAAGSGKSTLLKTLNIKDKENYIILATDDYRAVVLNEENEKTETNQIFVRTQDSAYAIKELVQDRLQSSTTSRANIILDCVFLEKWHRSLLENNQRTISAVACLNDISVVPMRAYNRALAPDSGPADKGRQVNTSSLLEGHASASAKLLTSIPSNVVTNLYDTSLAKEITPPVIARIDTQEEKSQIEIFDLHRLATFLAKANVNVEATKKADLYYNKNNENYRYVYDSQYCAQEIVNLIKEQPPHKTQNYDLILSSKKAKVPYLKIFADAQNNLNIKILNQCVFNDILNQSDKGETRILKNILMQIHFGSLVKTREFLASAKTTRNKRDFAFNVALNALEGKQAFWELDSNKKVKVISHYFNNFIAQMPLPNCDNCLFNLPLFKPSQARSRS